MADDFWKKFFDLSKTYTSVFEVAEYELEIGISKFKMADPKLLTTFEKKFFDLSETLRTSVFEVLLNTNF